MAAPAHYAAFAFGFGSIDFRLSTSDLAPPAEASTPAEPSSVAWLRTMLDKVVKGAAIFPLTTERFVNAAPPFSAKRLLMALGPALVFYAGALMLRWGLDGWLS